MMGAPWRVTHLGCQAGLLVTLVVILSSLSLPVHGSYMNASFSFIWTASEWTKCHFHDITVMTSSSCCACYRRRNVTCLFSQTGEEVSPFYCRKLHPIRPPDRESCPHCTQNCVLSLWSEWSVCSKTCGPATRHRIRQMLHPQANEGDECGPLLEVDPCMGLPLCSLIDPRPSYRWKVGPWTSCRKPNANDACGSGIRRRQVYCVNSAGDSVADLFCRHYYKGEQKPEEVEFCLAPCDCDLTQWSPWGPCSVTCHRGPRTQGYQVRTRSVRRRPENGGLGCPTLRETQTCATHNLMECPRYGWHMSEWGSCELTPNSTEKGCGPGSQQRQSFCIRDGDHTLTPVHDVLCLQDALRWQNTSQMLKPPEKRACQVACPQDCQLGEWQNWAGCTKSCGEGGVRIRTRPILVELTPGGQDCDTRFQTTACDKIPCHWWQTGRWSRCFLDSVAPDACGDGNQIRNVFCLSSMDEVLPDDNCTDIEEKPPTQQTCRVPCPDECVVSSWLDWGTCSATCGVKGGTQQRSRTILAQGQPGRPCMSDSELLQRRACNQRPCKTYQWQVSAWSVCIRHNNATEQCGEGTGVQQRALHCEMDSGYPVDERMCEPTLRPPEMQYCSAPCPQDCSLSPWSEWSECSNTCGRRSHRVRMRRVLQWALHDGKQCPDGTTSSGVVAVRKRCRRLPPCHAYLWLTGKWGPCDTVNACGHGIQQRNVTCAREDFVSQPDDTCFDHVPGARPETQQQCFEPCPGDCVLSEWSKFSACSQSCGDSPGYRNRNRKLINLDPHLDWSTQCPHISQSELSESVECGVQRCPGYRWETGPWGSCIVHYSQSHYSPFPCGEGIQQRHVFCVREDNVTVANHFCGSILVMPDKVIACTLHCPIDCQLSAWSDWSQCSAVCGEGTQMHERSILGDARHGGRQCRHLQEVQPCVVRDCEDLKWKVSKRWERCRPFYNLPCGKGTRTRRVTCPGGAGLDRECERREPKPADSEDCDMPCFGDCVMSEWTEWSECPCSAGGVRSRSREVERPPLPVGHQCGTQNETEPCRCHTYTLRVGTWSHCHLDRPLDADQDDLCGLGIRRRTIQCFREDGTPVSLSHCEYGDIPRTEPCDVECAIDCELSRFTPWTECTSECGMNAYKSRWMAVVTDANSWGRQCPPSEQLTQNNTCLTTPCYTYEWSRGPWSECSVDGQGCGVGERTRTVECIRSDGEQMDPANCIKSDSGRVESIHSLGEEEKVNMDLHTEKSCGQPCPGDCVVSEWSEYGPCFRNCSTHKGRGFQMRSRVILKDSAGGKPCPTDLKDVRACGKEEAICPTFMWRTSQWNRSGKRRIHCVTQDGEKVWGGCLQEEQPATEMHCSVSCGQYSGCTQGTCTCQQGFAGDGFQCLPEYGCEIDAHCVVNATFCDVTNKECLCQSGLLPDEDLMCPVVYLGEVGGVEDGDKARDEEEDTGITALFLYILVGSVCALVLISMCLVLLLLRKRRRKTSKMTLYGTPPLTKIDNLDTGSLKKRNNEDVQKLESPLLQKYTIKSNKNKHDDSLHKNSTVTYHANLARESPSGLKNEGPAVIFGGTKQGGKRVRLPEDGTESDAGTVQRPLMGNEEEYGGPPMFGTGPRPARRSKATPTPTVPETYSTAPRGGYDRPGNYVPETMTLLARGPSPAPSSGSRLSTFKPDSQNNISSHQAPSPGLQAPYPGHVGPPHPGHLGSQYGHANPGFEKSPSSEPVTGPSTFDNPYRSDRRVAPPVTAGEDDPDDLPPPVLPRPPHTRQPRPKEIPTSVSPWQQQAPSTNNHPSQQLPWQPSPRSQEPLPDPPPSPRRKSPQSRSPQRPHSPQKQSPRQPSSPRQHPHSPPIPPHMTYQQKQTPPLHRLPRKNIPQSPQHGNQLPHRTPHISESDTDSDTARLPNGPQALPNGPQGLSNGPVEGPEGHNSDSSNASGKKKNPASTKLLEYCDELIAELQTMASN